MTENMKKYTELVAADETLQAELKEMEKLPSGERAAAIKAHGAKLGVTLGDEDLAIEQNAELSDDELENVSGGSGMVIVGIIATLLAGTIILTPTTAQAAGIPATPEDKTKLV